MEKTEANCFMDILINQQEHTFCINNCTKIYFVISFLHLYQNSLSPGRYEKKSSLFFQLAKVELWGRPRVSFPAYLKLLKSLILKTLPSFLLNRTQKNPWRCRHSIYILEHGRIVLSGQANDLHDDDIKKPI